MTLLRTVVFLASLLAVVLAQTQCPYAPSQPGDRRQDKSVLKIAAYNAEWLFDKSSTSSSHINDVAQVIQTLNADILSLEEVEDCTILQNLCDATNMGYVPYLIKGTDSGTGQNVGIITKIDISSDMTRTEARVDYPLPGSQCGYTGQPGDTGVSKHYITTFNIGDKVIAMIGLHFLAFPTDPARCASREAQASVIREKINEHLALGHSIVVLGDFNDYSDDVPDVSNDVPTSRVVKIIRDGLIPKSVNSYYSTSTQEYPALYEISNLVVQKERYSAFCCDGKYSMIDHILVSADYMNVIEDAGFDHAYAPSVTSDHWPVYVQLPTPTDKPSSSYSIPTSGGVSGGPAHIIGDQKAPSVVTELNHSSMAVMGGAAIAVVVVAAIGAALVIRRRTPATVQL